MTVNINSIALAAALNTAPAGQIADIMRAIGFGSITRRLSATLRRQNPNAQTAGTASPYDLGTLQVIFLPDDAKAKSISRVCARANAGSVANGELTIEPAYTTPSTTQVAVTPSGNIAFLGSDEYSDVDIDYTPADQDVIEVTLPVVSNVIVLPTSIAGTAGAGTPATSTAAAVNNVGNAVGVNMIMEVTALAGTTTGNFIVIAPGSAPGTTKEVNLDVTKSKVQFKSSDAVTLARVKLGVFRAIDLNALLEAPCNFF